MRAPKGKLPYIDDDGVIVADFDVDPRSPRKDQGDHFDAHLSAEQRAVAWAVEKLCENHLYDFIVKSCWVDDANFNKGTAKFFNSVPAPIRPIVIFLVRRKIAKTLYLQGAGRFNDAEADFLAQKDIDALATLLGDKPYFFGDEPCGADATIFGFVAGLLWPGNEFTALRRCRRTPISSPTATA